MAKTIALKQGSTGTVVEIQAKEFLVLKPALGKTPIIQQFFSSLNAKWNKERKFYIRHDRNMDMDESVDFKAGLAAGDEDPVVDIELLKDPNMLAYKKVRYNKKIDTQVWEGKGIIVKDIAQLALSARTKRNAKFNSQIIEGIKHLHTLATSAATPKAATFSDGTAITGEDGNPYTMPNLVSIGDIDSKDVTTFTENNITGMVDNIFMQIEAIGKTGKDDDQLTKNWPYSKGYTENQLVIRVSSKMALMLSKHPAYKGNIANQATGSIAGGIFMIIDEVAFVKDPDFDERFLYQILPVGQDGLVFAINSYDFNTSINDHPDFPVDWWRLTASAGIGAKFNAKAFHYARFQFSKGTDLTTL